MATPYPPTVFVLGTARNIGKTVTCIGIISKLLSGVHNYSIDDIGYIKPVGQQTLTVLSEGKQIEADKDAVLITSLLCLTDCNYADMSPVVWEGGLSATFIDNGAQGNPRHERQAFLQRIGQAYESIAAGKRLVIVEGTGQPGVGSVAGISNADVINWLREMGVPVFVVLVAEGGIGSTIDQIFPYLIALEHLKTRVDGLIINGVLSAKMDKVRHYLETYYDHVFTTLYGKNLIINSKPEILGFVPSVPELRHPSMRLVAETFAKRPESEIELIAPEDLSEACALISKLKVISLDFGYESLLAPGDAVIVGVNANDAILALLLLHERMLRQRGQGLSGMILSCKNVGGLMPQTRELLKSGSLPTITLNYDSAEIVQRIESMTVKIQPYDEIKKQLIAQTYEEHLTLWPELTR